MDKYTKEKIEIGSERTSIKNIISYDNSWINEEYFQRFKNILLTIVGIPKENLLQIELLENEREPYIFDLLKYEVDGDDAKIKEIVTRIVQIQHEKRQLLEKISQEISLRLSNLPYKKALKVQTQAYEAFNLELDYCNFIRGSLDANDESFGDQMFNEQNNNGRSLLPNYPKIWGIMQPFYSWCNIPYYDKIAKVMAE